MDKNAVMHTYVPFQLENWTEELLILKNYLNRGFKATTLTSYPHLNQCRNVELAIIVTL